MKKYDKFVLENDENIKKNKWDILHHISTNTLKKLRRKHKKKNKKKKG